MHSDWPKVKLLATVELCYSTREGTAPHCDGYLFQQSMGSEIVGVFHASKHCGVNGEKKPHAAFFWFYSCEGDRGL